DDDEGPAARVQRRHAGGQGAVLRLRGHARGDPRRPAAAPRGAHLPHRSDATRGGRALLDRHRSRGLPREEGRALSPGARGRRPAAPETRVPRAVGDLTVVIRESTVELTWTNPVRRVDSTPLRDLTLARVFRVDDAGGGEPKAAMQVDGRIAGYMEVATVPLDA